MPNQAMGAHARVVMEFEDSPGIENAEHKKAIHMMFINSNIKAEQNQSTSNVITGNRNPVVPFRGFITTEGEAEYPLDTAQIGMLLTAAFGLPETTSESNKYKHVFKIKKQMPSFTYEQGFQDISVYNKYIGCKISKLSFSFGGDSELTVQASIMGIKEESTGATIQENAPVLAGQKLNFDNAFLKEGEEELAIATEASLDIDFGLDGDTYAIGGGGFRSFINDGIVEITGSTKTFFKDSTLSNKAINGTNTSIEIDMRHNDESMTILLPEVKYTRSTPGIDGPSGVYENLNFNAFYAENEHESAIVITLVNKIASYDIPAVESASMMSSQKLM